MYIYEIPVRELTSAAAVLRVAAEVIQVDMEREWDRGHRIGCCGVFNRMRMAVTDDFFHGKISPTESSKVHEAIDDAKSEFTKLHYTDGARRTGDTAYWMGTRNNEGQLRRITALLATAELL